MDEKRAKNWAFFGDKCLIPRQQNKMRQTGTVSAGKSMTNFVRLKASVFNAKKLISGGFTFIEVLVALAIMGITMLAMITMHEDQLKSNNFLEFQLKRTQLQNNLVGQVFNISSNCSCLFAGASPFSATPVAPGATLSGYAAPSAIGRFASACASVPQPLVSTAGVDSVKLVSASLTNIMNVSGSYSGVFVLDVQSMKAVVGPSDLFIRIPVDVTVTPAGPGLVNFVSCSTSATTGPLGTCPPGLLSTGYDSVTGVLQCQPPTYQ